VDHAGALRAVGPDAASCGLALFLFFNCSLKWPPVLSPEQMKNVKWRIFYILHFSFRKAEDKGH
jgi:hypothetical protein